VQIIWKLSNIEKTTVTFEANLPSQSSDPKHEISVDIIAKEDEVVAKDNRVESVELMEPKEDAEIKEWTF